jgi:hypothetical protein
MVQAIQVLRFHLLELEKVTERFFKFYSHFLFQLFNGGLVGTCGLATVAHFVGNEMKRKWLCQVK